MKGWLAVERNWAGYPEMVERLGKIRSFIFQQVQVDNQEIQRALTDFATSGGKMLRPAFCLMFADTITGKTVTDEKMLKIAATLELLHMATLIHDDIIDDSPLRHNQVTIQACYGKDVAVYTGDLLFTQFFELLIQLMNGTDYLMVNAQAMKRVLLGELQQMQNRFDEEIEVCTYLKSVEGKTAELFALAAQEGVYFSDGTPEQVMLAGEIGRKIGIAFQINDDILDYTGSQQQMDKPVLEDLGQGVYSLPLILAKEAAPEVFAPYLAKGRQITLAEVAKVAELVVSHGGIEAARELARELTLSALADIEKLPATPGRYQLAEITGSLLQRNH